MDVIVGSAAPELERFAAQELCDYLAKLYGIRTHPVRQAAADAEAVFFIGGPGTNTAVLNSLGEDGFGKVTDQGLVLKRAHWEGTPALVVGGGSPRATLWAVYELVERWGVRYLTDRDVLPERKEEFQLPDLDVLMEPVFRIRAHPTIQDFACSGEAWGIADFRVLLDQLAKMKFSRVNIYPFGYQPYLHWESKGVERRSAWLWYDFNYPITPDMVGRKLFGDSKKFWNPDLPEEGTYEELVAAGERQIHNLIEHAHRRGLETNNYADITQFPPEFAPLLKDAQKVRQLGQLMVVPGASTPVDDASYRDLCTAVLKTIIETYPETDLITISIPEWRQWTEVYEDAWNVLDAKYGLSEVLSLADALEAGRNRKWFRGPEGWKKSLDEVKGDLASLVFYDHLLESLGPLQGSTGAPKRIMFWGMAEELWPLLGKILDPGTEVGLMPDNFQTHVLKRREIFSTFPTTEVAGVLHLTLDDDNVGVMPQITISAVHELVKELRKGWAGFSARERFPADHDWVLAYLSRAGWDAEATPDAVAADFLQGVCGQACGEALLEAFRDVEAATTAFEQSDYGFGFPVPQLMMKHWRRPGPIPEYLAQVRDHYRKALEASRRAHDQSKGAGRSLPAFWIGRLEFAVGYVNAVEAVRLAAEAESSGHNEEALNYVRHALRSLKAALESYARVARNRTDLGVIAIVNEYGYRPLLEKSTELGAATFMSPDRPDRSGGFPAADTPDSRSPEQKRMIALSPPTSPKDRREAPPF